MGRGSPVMPRVPTLGVCTSPLVLLVSSQRVLQVATTPPVAWTAPFSPWLSLSRSSSFPRLCRCFGELARSRLGISSQATPPSALPASPRPRCQVSCDCRASVSPHCLLRRELTSPELRRGHQCHGQGSIVHHFFSFLSLKLHLVMLMLVGIFFRPVSDQRCRRSAAHHCHAAIREGKILRVR